jgi:hypothetical protein
VRRAATRARGKGSCGACAGRSGRGGAAELGIRERAAPAEEEGGAWARHGWELGEKAAARGKVPAMGEARDQERAERARGRGREERLGRRRKLVRWRLDKAPARVGDEDKEAAAKKNQRAKDLKRGSGRIGTEGFSFQILHFPPVLK